MARARGPRQRLPRLHLETDLDLRLFAYRRIVPVIDFPTSSPPAGLLDLRSSVNKYHPRNYERFTAVGFSVGNRQPSVGTSRPSPISQCSPLQGPHCFDRVGRRIAHAARNRLVVKSCSGVVGGLVRSRSSPRPGLMPDMGVSIASFRHESQSFPEGDTLDGGIERHHPNASECPFEESLSDRATDTGPTESPADIKTPHPQRIRDYGVDRDAADGSQNLIRVRGEQRFTGSIETDDAGPQSFASRSRNLWPSARASKRMVSKSVGNSSMTR
jgi:hypothetical protein